MKQDTGNRRFGISPEAVATGLAKALGIFRARDRGQARFFRNQTYHLQTVRVLNDAPYFAAEIGEVLATVGNIATETPDNWFAEWMATARRVEGLGAATSDPRSQGYALLRAHNYYRNAESLLPAGDARREEAFRKSVDTFHAGLARLGVGYERIHVPFGDHHLNALFFPGGEDASRRPLIVVHGGLDSTLEELYFVVAAAGVERGHDVLLFEGPGQGSVIRQQGLPFLKEWERPTGAVLDAFFAAHPGDRRVVLVGMSFGGCLAPRAAAFDERIDGVVAYDVFFDFGEIVDRAVPKFIQEADPDSFLIRLAVAVKKRLDPSFRWSADQSSWVMGADNVIEAGRKMKEYHLRDVAERIRQDVLILAGTRDHFIPLNQVEDFSRALVNARSVESRIYDAASGGSEHCQLGAATLWHADFFDWLARRFPPA